MKKEEDFEVPNDDILGGIKAAVERGHTLKQAMVTLFNAGYSKDEIEDAARKYMMGKSEENVYQTQPKNKKSKEIAKSALGESEEKVEISRSPGEKPGVSFGKNEDKKENKVVKGGMPEDKSEKKSKNPATKLMRALNPKTPQKVSNYDQTPKKKRKLEPITIVLILLLIVLAGILVAVFLFKAELVDFFNKLFG